MMPDSFSNHWLICPRANPKAETRLLLFPYAGGSPAGFNKLALEFPSHIEVWIAHYPGRGSRHHEAPIKQISTFAEELSQAIRPLFDKPFAFFGHSLGGLVAFELARQLEQKNLPPPELLFVSACGAPHLPDQNPPIHALSDAEFIEALRQLNGIPSELLHQPDVMQVFLPVLRADVEAIETYQYAPNDSPLHIPIFALAGWDDPHLSRERIEGWACHTDAGFQPLYFHGDHFFINTCREAVITCISEELIAYAKK